MTAPSLDGAGLLSSFDDVRTAISEQDAAGVAFTGIVAGLDALAFVADPVGELGTAGLGWLMEHVEWLRIPLDELCGDPVQITARAEDWQRISVDLGTAATALDGLRADAGGWEGAAAAGFGRAVTGNQEALRAMSTAAREVSELVLGSASMVGTERSIVRDLIAELVVRLITTAVTAGVTALATAGTTAPLVVGSILLQVADTAATIARRIEDLATKLREAGAVMGRLEDTMRTGLLPGALRGPEATEGVGLVQDTVLEYGKQEAAARAAGAGSDDGGDPPAPG